MIFQTQRLIFSFISKDFKACVPTLHNTLATLVRPNLISNNFWKMWYPRSSLYLPPSVIINNKAGQWRQTADARNQEIIILMVIAFGLMMRDKCLSDLFLQIPE